VTPVLGIVQMRCAPDPDANLAHACEMVRDAARQGANVICLPELFRSQYFCQVEDHKYFQLAESIPGPSTQALGEIARECGVVIVASLFERRAAGLYHNTAAILDADGALMGRYRKMHIPDDPLFYEKFYFTPGDLGFLAWETAHAPIGVCVCWDQWYPEAARLTALRGAQILFYPTAIGWHPGEREQYGAQQHDAWETIQRSHAIANGCYVAAANRVGHEAPDGGPGLDFWGQSFIAGPDGVVLARAGVDEETILIQEVSLKRLETQRTHWPFLRDRRVDAYGGIEQRMID
jgi:N-carbamoylputrescine amidase